MGSSSSRHFSRHCRVGFRPHILGATFMATFVLFAVWQGRAQNPSKADPQFLNTKPNVHYVGSKVCAGCHKSIYQDFSKTDMGNSMFTPNRLVELGWLTKPVDFFNDQHNRHYQIYAQDSKVYESEYEVDAEGKELFRHTEALEYVIGTGANGATPVVRRENYFFQAPISYYAATKSWNLSPNYEVRDLGFNLPVTSDCIGCHSGRVRTVAGRDDVFDDPPVLETAIGCENCHGPGELHVAERQMDTSPTTSIDLTIVNPGRLSPWLADNICMNCHEGDIRVFRKGKSWTDFRPGTPLNDTVSILKAPIDRKAQQSPLLEHYYSMTLSKCYRESAGKLSCQSCHDPHVQPSTADAPQYFREKCLQCHTEKSCKLNLQERRARQPDDACTTCHMAKRPALTVSHSTLTDHRILRTADEAYPKSAFAESLPGAGFIYVNATPGKAENVSDVDLLKAYRKEIMRSNLEYKDRYFVLLGRLEKSRNNDPFVLSAIAQKAGSNGDLPKAIRYAREVIEQGSTLDFDYLLLDGFLARSGQSEAAIDVLKKGISFAPYNNSLYESLAARELEIKDAAGAAATLAHGLELFPEDIYLRNLQGKVSAEERVQEGIATFKRGDLQGAMEKFQLAAQANPDDAIAHDYIGVILGESGRLDEAMREFRQAVQLSGNFPDPHFHLGLAYLKTGKVDAAIFEYQEALRLNPAMTEAKYGLSEICAKLGDLDGAISLLRQIVQAEPDFAEGYYNLGLNLWNRYKNSSGLRQQSDLDEAASDERRASELAPSQPRSFAALGQILADRGDFGPAIESLRKAIELYPSNPEYHYDLGLILRRNSDFALAGDQFRIVVQIAPKNALAHRSLGLVLRETGDLEGAATELGLAVSSLPEDSEGHHLLGTVLLKQGHAPEAIAELRKAIELDPSLTDARASLAQALQKAGQKEESQAVVAELQKINTEKSNMGQAMILVQTAAGYSKKSDYAAAARTLEEAVRLRPDFIEAQYQLALALRDSSDPKKAIEIFRRIIQADPDHALAHFQLGDSLTSSAKAEAKAELEKSLQLSPSLAQAHIALGNLAKSSQDWTTAIREFESALAWEPQDREVHYDLALALKASGKTEEAAHEMQLAKELTPTTRTVH
jgi:tetratricopeptide (TPR) repeat protein